MTHRHRLFIVASIGALAGLVAAAACSFPEPQFVPDEGGTNGDGNVADTSSGGPDGSSGRDADPFADVVEPDAPPPIDATSEKPPVDAAGCFCDCDKDGYRSASQDAAACDGSVPAAIDCDDLDIRANPDSGYRKDLPTTDTRGDWNCDMVTNRFFKRVNLKCSELSTGILGDCEGAEGFTSDPGCGVEATYVVCTESGLPAKCVEKSNILQTQQCK